MKRQRKGGPAPGDATGAGMAAAESGAGADSAGAEGPPEPAPPRLPVNLKPMSRGEWEYECARDAIDVFLLLMDMDGARAAAVPLERLSGYRLRGELWPTVVDDKLRPECKAEVRRMGPVALRLSRKVNEVRAALGEWLRWAHGRHWTLPERRALAFAVAGADMAGVVRAWNAALFADPELPACYLPVLCRRCGRPVFRRARNPANLSRPALYCSDPCRTARRPRPHKRNRRLEP